jgi:two-component system LytT family response regulator
VNVPAEERQALRVLVVDDEPLGRRRLLDLLEGEPDVSVVGTAADGEGAVEAIRTLRPDLVFLDVQMPRMSGLDVVRSVGIDAMPPTVFVTAYEEYALQAFDASAVDYLLKPFRDDRFEEAMRRARRRVGSAPPQYLDRIAVHMRGQTRSVPVSQVDYIMASGPYAELHVASQRHLVRESMQHLEDRLDPAQFVRIHRSTIVRIELVEALLRSEGSEYHVLLKGGRRLRVGRSRRGALEQRLGGAR